jgi:hypothetical protein
MHATPIHSPPKPPDQLMPQLVHSTVIPRSPLTPHSSAHIPSIISYHQTAAGRPHQPPLTLHYTVASGRATRQQCHSAGDGYWGTLQSSPSLCSAYISYRGTAAGCVHQHTLNLHYPQGLMPVLQLKPASPTYQLSPDSTCSLHNTCHLVSPTSSTSGPPLQHTLTPPDLSCSIHTQSSQT